MCILIFISLIAGFTYEETEHWGFSWQYQEVFFAPSVSEFSVLLASYQQLCIQLPDRANISGSKNYRHSFLLLQFHFHCWKCYECRKRSWASPPLKMCSTRLIALPKEICRRARNRTRISWQPALCLQLKAILLQRSLLANRLAEGGKQCFYILCLKPIPDFYLFL